MMFSAMTPPVALANPDGGIVAAGGATISATGPKLDIHQSTDKAIIDWRSFDIQSLEWTEFHQPSSASITLNRVNAADPSRIDGKLTANGHVVIVNPNGVFFGSNSRIDVGSLTATTANIDNNDFMAGRMEFKEPGSVNAKIVNEGMMTIREAGLASFVAPQVQNHGLIHAKLGKVHLASGETFTLDMAGDGLIKVAVAKDYLSGHVINSGRITADGGSVTLSAAAARQIVDSLVANTGVIEARSLGTRNGRVTLHAEGSNAVAGNRAEDKRQKSGESIVLNTGVIDASGRGEGQRGGKVEVLGDNVVLAQGSVIDASGDKGGGDIRIGGDYRGTGDTAAALNTYVDAASLIFNDALSYGDGGRTIVWSDGDTAFYGNIYGRGGALGGNGGFAETSGHDFLDARGYVDLTAVRGEKGTYLLDPTDVTIYGNVASVFDTAMAGYWNFDAGAGATAADSSGNGNTGALMNGASWSSTIAPTPQANNYSMSFDGTNDYVTVADSPSLALSNAVSVSLWFLADTSGGFDGLASRSPDPAQGWEFDYTRAGNTGFSVGTGAWVDAVTAPPSTGVWRHAAGTWDGATIRLYIDGAEVGSAAQAGSMSIAASDLTIGAMNREIGASEFDGLIDDLRVYGSGISANDVSELYGSRFTVAGIEKMSQTANVSILASNDITFNLDGDTLDLTSGRNLTVTAGRDILSASAGTVTVAGAGGIALNAGRDISFAHDLDLNATGSGAVTLRADNSIVHTGSGDITTQGGAITLNSDRDGGGAGAIFLGVGTALASNGGDVIMGGGANPLTTAAIGTAAHQGGIDLTTSTVNAAGGDISLRGQGYALGSGTALTGPTGVRLRVNSSLQTNGDGAIDVHGVGAGTSSGTGVFLTTSYITAFDGDITVTGRGGDNSLTSPVGVRLTFSGVVSSYISATGDGSLYIEGTGGLNAAATDALGIWNTTGPVVFAGLHATTGNITLIGTGGTSGVAHAINVSGTGDLIATTTGAVNITAITQSAGSFGMRANGGAPIWGGASMSGPITITTDSFSLASPTPPRIMTTGALTIRPYTASKTIGVNGGAGDLNLSSLLLDNITVGSLTLGRTDGVGLLTANARSWTAPVTLQTSTGGVSVNGVQTMGARTFTARTYGASDITFGASGGVTSTAAGTAITLASGRNVINNAGAGALSASAGNWLVYSTNPASDTIGALASGYRRFSCAFGGSCPALGGGNGLLYSYTPTLTATPNALSIVYGAAAPSLTGYAYAVSGHLASDSTVDVITGSLDGATTYTLGGNVGSYNINHAGGALTSAMGYGFTYADNATALTITAPPTAPPTVLPAVSQAVVSLLASMQKVMSSPDILLPSPGSHATAARNAVDTRPAPTRTAAAKSLDGMTSSGQLEITPDVRKEFNVCVDGIGIGCNTASVF